MSPIRPIIVGLACLLAASVGTHADVPRVRGITPSARALVERGIRESPSFRALVERLKASDVVVYVEEDYFQSSALAGQLSFLSKAGGYRYLSVRLPWKQAERRLISALGHELQHAVEIAERPQIVDQESLARTYSGFGIVNPPGFGATGVFDTTAAIQTGDQVWSELMDGANGD